MGKVNKKIEEEKSDKQIVFEALEKAIEAFESHVNSYNMDVSYFALRITCWGLSTNDFAPLDKIEIDQRSSADGKYHEEKE
jgi:hypothetical protein